jgi:uncharacterized cupin superfamily protein
VSSSADRPRNSGASDRAAALFLDVSATTPSSVGRAAKPAVIGFACGLEADLLLKTLDAVGIIRFMTGMPDPLLTQAAALTISHEPLPPDQVVAGQPAAGSVELSSYHGVEVGVWEMTPGTATDTEADEVFVVLSGHGRIQFTNRSLAPIDLAPGSVVRLEAGMRTVWTVTETLRKLYIA